MTPDYSTPPAPLARKSAASYFTGPLAAMLVLLVSYILMLESARDKSITIDEPGHAFAGYSYWKLNDYRLDPENGNLPKRLAALPLIFGSQPYEITASARWPSSHAMLMGDEFFNRSTLDTASLTSQGRAACALLAVALSLVVWLWSRRLFGPIGGMISLVACAFNPGVLANGPLMTSDLAVTLFFILSLWRISATLERVTVGRVVGSILAVSGLFLSKMSAALVVPMTLLLVVARVAEGSPLPFGLRLLQRRTQQLGAIVFVAAIHFFGVLIVVWGFYGFRFSAFSPDIPGPARFNEPWIMALDRPDVPATIEQLNLTPSQRTEAGALFDAAGVNSPVWSYAAVDALERIKSRVLKPDQVAQLAKLQAAPPEKFAARIIQIARDFAILPEAYLYGLAKVARTSEQTRTFLNGEVSFTGKHTFFPYVFLVKSPLPLLALLLIAAAALWYRAPAAVAAAPAAGESQAGQLTRLWPTLPLWILIGVYGGIAIASSLNLGHRHLLPIYPALFILCGRAGCWFAFDPQTELRRFGLTVRHLRVATLALVGALGLEVTVRFPNYLAYFNGIVAPSKAYRHLVDSSLDWGQELPAISRYLRQFPDRPAYMAYLGLARPSYYGIAAKQIGGHIGVDWKSDQPIVLINDRTRAEIDDFIRTTPGFADATRFEVANNAMPPTVLFRSGASLRLTGGTYVISATMLQPLYYSLCNGPWTVAYETTYQQIKAQIEPMISDDLALRAARLPQVNVQQWTRLYDYYITYRFARLAAFLRSREPDAQINHSVLVYHLTDADVAQALEGPPPLPKS